MDDREFVDDVVAAARAIPTAIAVALGGSRARGVHRPSSDWDFAVYFRGALDVGPLRRLPWEGTVFEPGAWGRIMYGGAVFDVDGRHFDLHYRNLDTVEDALAEAVEGRFSIDLLSYYLVGIPSYTLVGELATNQVLWGDLPRPGYPDKLRATAPPHWMQRADNELSYARFYADTENPVSCAGSLTRAIHSAAHAILAARGEWALNEKRIVRAAGLDSLFGVLGALGTSPVELHHAIDRVREAIHAHEASRG